MINKWFSWVSHKKLTCEKATCRAHDWKMKSHASLEVFTSVSWERPTHEGLVKLSVWQKVMFCLTMSLPILYIPTLPINCKECFFREKTLKYTLESTPIIIYTFPCRFSQLLPLHLYILERLIAQILTTPILSVKWEFGAARKYWKEPFIGRCNWAELWNPEDRKSVV